MNWVANEIHFVIAKRGCNSCYIQWQFQSSQVTRAGDTRSKAAMFSARSNKHNSPEFYPGNARACPGLEPPMFMYYWIASENYSCTIDLLACGEYLCTFMHIGTLSTQGSNFTLW